MTGITANFDIKNGEIAEPKLYMGGNVENFHLPNGKYEWSITSNSYMKGSIDTLQMIFAEYGRTLNTGKRPHKRPITHRYKPKMDTTDECDADHTLRYQRLIGILRLAVEL